MYTVQLQLASAKLLLKSAVIAKHHQPSPATRFEHQQVLQIPLSQVVAAAHCADDGC